MSDNIKVAVRVRPLIKREKEANKAELWKVKDGKYIFQESAPSKQFCFDRVFNPTEENEVVYQDLCLPIVESVMQGINGTIFAYGQTSSGKTFTMMGDRIFTGVLQYSIEDVFKLIQKMPDREFLLRVSFIEIYNEKVYDLLSDKNEELKLCDDAYGTTNVSGLLEKIVQREDQIWDCMEKGQSKRRTGETAMNRNSSRSHSIFRMIIESRVKDQDAADQDAVVNVSQLNLVDLAGSENLNATSTKGKVFKEGVHINLSLYQLNQVISQLSDPNKTNKQNIIYRNSKLTRLLQNALGGNSLTAIICAVSPADGKETLSTIKFAQNAKEIKNKPTVNEIFNEQALLKRYANRIKMLTEALQVSKKQGKELAEKTKQNEILKLQIEALKKDFVSQTGIARSSRRKTCSGPLVARHLQLEHFAPLKYPAASTYDLPTLEEDAEGEQEALDNNRSSISNRKSNCSSFRMSVSRKILNIGTQTDFDELKVVEEIDIGEILKVVSDLHMQLNLLQNELTELQDFTTLEKQSIKAESELHAENETLKNENTNLSRQLDELKSKSRTCSCSFENSRESGAESCPMSRTSTPKDNVFKACQTSPKKLDSSSDSTDEQREMLEQGLRSKVIELESSCREQKEALEIAQSEWNAKTQLIVKELESKHEAELAYINQQLKNKLNDLASLQERYSDLEECNKQLSQKVCDLETYHSTEMKVVEEKYKAAEFELQKVTESLKNHQKELAEIQLLLEGNEISNLEDIKSLRSKYCELEESNMSLKQKLSDLESAHCIELREAEAKCEKAHSELLTMTKDLEAKQKELAEAHNQLSAVTKDLNDMNFLQEKCSNLIQYNNDLRKKITDIENSHWDELEKLEENFKIERSEWETQILKKFKDLDAEHQQELKDLEKKVSENHMEKFNEKIQDYVNEACELREEVKHLKISNEELSNFVQDQSNKIEELENLNAEKSDQITNLKQEKDNSELAIEKKYEDIIVEYKSRQRQCRDINRQLKNEVRFYKEKIEKITNGTKTSSGDAENLRLITDLTKERDDLVDKIKIADQEIHDLKSNFKKVKKNLDEQIKVVKLTCEKMEKLEEKCKMLSFKLDQKKAKIISLESNNTRMIEEIKKLNEKLSSRHVPCKCEVITKELKSETLQTPSDCGPKVKNEKSDEKVESKVEVNSARKVSNDDDSHKENDSKGNENLDGNMMAGGPADMIRCFRLEGIIRRRDKELKKLQKENDELKSELWTIRTRPMNLEHKMIEVRNPDLKKVPMSPLREKNEDLTVKTNVTPNLVTNRGAIPKIVGKQEIIRERYKKKPYEHPPKAVNTEVCNKNKQEPVMAEVKENIKRPPTCDDVLKMIAGNADDSQVPNCNQQ